MSDLKRRFDKYKKRDRPQFSLGFRFPGLGKFESVGLFVVSDFFPVDLLGLRGVLKLGGIMWRHRERFLGCEPVCELGQFYN